MTGFGNFGGESGFDSGDAYTHARANSAQSSARSAQDEVRYLEQRVERLAMICQAMWTLLQQQTSLGEQDLFQRLSELQAQNDQANQAEPANTNEQRPQCPNCGRTFNPRHDKCLYCGTAKPAQTAFDLL
jgi:ribosomal protein S27AE